MDRAILLADMNAFFASVHQALDPELRGKPVIVAGDPGKRHGIVLTASYEAKKKGVKTGTVVWDARQRCPDGIFIKPQYDLYVDFSSRILNIMNDFTPLVEPFSIDEAFMDVTGSQKLFGSPVEIAKQLKERIRRETGITCSVGVGPNKLLAKMAADLQKPDGLTVMSRKEMPILLWPLPVRKLFGVGHRYEQHLHKLNIHTIGDLAKYPVSILKKKFGLNGETLWLSANGIDSSPVDPDSLNQVKSIGQQITLPRDYRGNEINVIILELSDLVAYRVRAGSTWGRPCPFPSKTPTSAGFPECGHYANPPISPRIFLLLPLTCCRSTGPRKPVRLVGVTLANLFPSKVEQTELFGNREKIRGIEKACDQVRERYGKAAVFRAVSLKEGCLEHVRHL